MGKWIGNLSTNSTVESFQSRFRKPNPRLVVESENDQHPCDSPLGGGDTVGGITSPEEDQISRVEMEAIDSR